MVDADVGSLTIRVAVVARAAVERSGLVAILSGAAPLSVVHSADSLGDLAAVADRDVDVVVASLASPADLAAPLDVTADLAHRAPALVVLLDDAPAEWVARALHQGVVAVLPREATADELTAAVQAAGAGLITLARDHLDAIAPARAVRRTTPSVVEPLTPREMEILGLLADGLANKEIAAHLDISAHTVKTHVQSLFAKLGADSRAEAVALGIRRGLILL